MTQSGIYKLQSKCKPGRVYIGSSCNLLKRKQTHFISLRHGTHHSRKLQNHFNKYGESDLVFSVITTCERDELIQKEQFYIDSYNPWFNTRRLAESNIGVVKTDSTRSKISNSLKGNVPWNKGKTGFIMSDEAKKKHSLAMKGKHHSGNFVKGQQPRLGSHCSDVTKGKIGEANKLNMRELWKKRKENNEKSILTKESRDKISKSLHEYWEKKREGKVA